VATDGNPNIRPKKSVQNKKKNRSLIKKASVDYGQGINPISRLIQIQQAKKEREPLYSLVDMRGVPKRREFVMEVVVGEHKCTGVGPNKKLAKRNAAEAMLVTLGYSRPMPKPQKPAIKTETTQQGNLDKKVTFVDPDQARQFIPGVIVMPRTGVNGQVESAPRTIGPAVIGVPGGGVRFAAPDQTVIPSTPGTAGLRPKQQLQYLAELLGLHVQFTDFPKGPNKLECLSLVSLSTNPPQVCHGTGPTIEASHDNAARVALNVLAQLGIGQVPPIAATAPAAPDSTSPIAAGAGAAPTEAATTPPKPAKTT
jgi:double-stranded RNA-binding protein Staufen